MLGYPPGMKGYKLLDIDSMKILISRDVIFYENVFPFHNISDTYAAHDPIEDMCLPVLLHNDISPSVPIRSLIHDQEQMHTDVGTHNNHS